MVRLATIQRKSEYPFIVSGTPRFSRISIGLRPGGLAYARFMMHKTPRNGVSRATGSRELWPCESHRIPFRRKGKEGTTVLPDQREP